MIKIERAAWEAMVAHARSAYPEECCGAMFGARSGDDKIVTDAWPMENKSTGVKAVHYVVSNDDLLAADAEAERRGARLLGIFHSHPDCDAYFSETDLKNSCPWLSFVILSIKRGEFDHAHSFLPDYDQTDAVKEEITIWQQS